MRVHPDDSAGWRTHSPDPRRPDNEQTELHSARRPCPTGPASLGEISFETLFRSYHSELCAFACGYVDRPVAEELVDDVFLRVWGRRSTWSGWLSPRRYLYAAVRNQALKHLAHEAVVRRSHALVMGQGRVPGMSQTPVMADAEVQAVELAAALGAAIKKLPARCREAFTLRREHGMTYAEIAKCMGTSVRTVETQLARADKALRRQLGGWLQ